MVSRRRFLQSTVAAPLAGVGGLWGVVSAVKARTQIDYWVTIASLFGYSMPTFWLGIMLILVFSVRLNWLPSSGRGNRYVGRGSRAVLVLWTIPAIEVRLTVQAHC